MATAYYYIEAPGERMVSQWFRSLSDAPDELRTDGFTTFYFKSVGELVFEDNTRRIDPAQSPVVTLFEPKQQRSALWTVGEVHFLAKHVRSRFPALARMQKQFGIWLATNPIVWDQRDDNGTSSGYYLEGGISNLAEKIYALPSGQSTYDAGRYFVGHGENDVALDRICRSLRLRGVECA